MAEGWSARCMSASQTSMGLCGGMLVAMPTAMPEAPFTSRLGSLAGRTSGSLRVPSKFSAKSTVFWSMLASISSAMGAIRASVYRIAAGGSLSTEPKLPWPSTSGIRRENGCAMRTSASYTAPSPCGCHLPSTSPTRRALFLCCALGRMARSCMAYRIRRWTGLSPSRMSGNARDTITLMA